MKVEDFIKKHKRNRGAGRKPATNVFRYTSTGDYLDVIHVVISEDIVEKMGSMAMQVVPDRRLRQRHGLRLAWYVDPDGPEGTFFFRIAPPAFENPWPRFMRAMDYHFHPPKYGRQFRALVPCSLLGLAIGVAPRRLHDIEWVDGKGLRVFFPLEDRVEPGESARERPIELVRDRKRRVKSYD